MATAVIPARMTSQRLPGKPLIEVAGRPLIQHVVEAVRKSRRIDRIVVAADDERILDAARAAGAEGALTRPDHPSGTDRVAEVARGLDDEIIVNVQGDEPEVAATVIDTVVGLLDRERGPGMATAASPIRHIDAFLSPHLVKVVLDLRGRALYFSRSPIPYVRDDASEERPRLPAEALGHLGLYAYRKDVLLALVEREPSPLEQLERLEQLRALQVGIEIGVAVVGESAAGIDTPADLEAFRRRVEGS